MFHQQAKHSWHQLAQLHKSRPLQPYKSMALTEYTTVLQVNSECMLNICHHAPLQLISFQMDACNTE